MSVTQISETSKIIKEKMDIELKAIIASFELTADFFITSHSLRQLWSTCFSHLTFKVGLDIFIQAADSAISQNLMASRENLEIDSARRDLVRWLFSASQDSTGELQVTLDNIVNMTDFVELGTLLRMFGDGGELLDYCVDKLRTETEIGLSF